MRQIVKISQNGQNMELLSREGIFIMSRKTSAHSNPVWLKILSLVFLIGAFLGNIDLDWSIGNAALFVR